MNPATHVMTGHPHRSRRMAAVLAVALVALSLVACSTKSEAQLASDALDKGLQAHVAGNVDEAVTDYQECLKHDAANKLCHYNLGLIAQTKGDAVTAENEYRLSLTTDPNYAPAIFNLAILRTNAGSTQEAIDLYKHYIEIKPDEAGGHLNLGLLLVATGDTKNGNAELAKAIALNPATNVPAQSAAASPAPS